MKTLKAISALGISALITTTSFSQTLNMTKVSTYNTGIFDESASEIVTYDVESKQLFFTNAYDKTIDVLDISTPETPTKVKSISLSTWGASANSVASYGGHIAVAVEDTNKQANGKIVILLASDGSYVHHYDVGALPDMVTFSPNGKFILVACEGEPSDDYSLDPEGQIGIIDIAAGIDQGTTTMINFNQFDSQKDTLKSKGVRIFGNNGNSTVSQDLEPEYIAVSPDNKTAVVTLQENNAIAIVDIATKSITSIKALSLVDHSITSNGFDASDKDGIIDIKARPTFGMPMPDAISSYSVGGKTYYVTANEGDTRDYDGYSEEIKVGKMNLDTIVFPNHVDLKKDENLGRLLSTTANGDTDGDGDIDKIYSIGTRSFSIWDSAGTRVYDSGNAFETHLATNHPTYFNTSNSKNVFDDRSDAKGCEPEALTLATIDGKVYAFIGLERMGGIMVYDITDPTNPVFNQYELNRDFTADVSTPAAKDLGPEGMVYIEPANTPVKDVASKGMLAVANEVSGTVTIYALGTYTPTSTAAVKGVSFNAYPNPNSSGQLNLTVSDYYTINDVYGNTVNQFYGNSVTISNLSSGIYFIKNESGVIHKVVKN